MSLPSSVVITWFSAGNETHRQLLAELASALAPIHLFAICELGPDDIRVNALLPGIVEGPRMDGVIQARAEQLGLEEPEMRKRYIEKISLKRMVTAEDVALMALFLCSSAARNITGQAISVDGNVEYL